MIETHLGNKKIQVHDNVLPDVVVDKWLKFYENDAVFSLSGFEDKNRTKSPVYFMMPVTFKHRFEVFEIDGWLEEYLTNFNPECRLKHFNRSYINLMTAGDTAHGHVDVGDFDASSFFITCLIFLNPHVDENSSCGFYIEDFYVQNKFNRMIMFDGRLFHKPEIPTDDLVRLTGYFSFSNFKKTNSYDSEKSFASNNQWFKKI